LLDLDIVLVIAILEYANLTSRKERHLAHPPVHS